MVSLHLFHQSSKRYYPLKPVARAGIRLPLSPNERAEALSTRRGAPPKGRL